MRRVGSFRQVGAGPISTISSTPEWQMTGTCAASHTTESLNCHLGEPFEANRDRQTPRADHHTERLLATARTIYGAGSSPPALSDLAMMRTICRASRGAARQFILPTGNVVGTLYEGESDHGGLSFFFCRHFAPRSTRSIGRSPSTVEMKGFPRAERARPARAFILKPLSLCPQHMPNHGTACVASDRSQPATSS